jgi:ABC-2 type transport system ATP-binding protein
MSDAAQVGNHPVAVGPRSDEAIVVRGLVKRYGDRTAVNGIDLTVQRGEVFGILGPNGAGKSTIVEILEGYRRADTGDVRVLGLDPIRDRAILQPRVGLMLQNGGIYQYGRPRELLHLFAAFYREPMSPDALLEEVGLSTVATQPYRLLSGGERQRLALALALVGRPDLAILDEPTAGMDPAARAHTRELIAGLRRRGVTVVLTTHDLGDVEVLADRVAIVSKGRLLAEGSPASLATSGADALAIRFARPLTRTEAVSLSAAQSRGVLDEPGLLLRVAGAAADPAVAAQIAAWAATNGIAIAELRTGQATLEARYLALVGHEDVQA